MLIPLVLLSISCAQQTAAQMPQKVVADEILFLTPSSFLASYSAVAVKAPVTVFAPILLHSDKTRSR
jgi:hypothetical protein